MDTADVLAQALDGDPALVATLLDLSDGELHELDDAIVDLQDAVAFERTRRLH